MRKADPCHAVDSKIEKAEQREGERANEAQTRGGGGLRLSATYNATRPPVLYKFALAITVARSLHPPTKRRGEDGRDRGDL